MDWRKGRSKGQVVSSFLFENLSKRIKNNNQILIKLKKLVKSN